MNDGGKPLSGVLKNEKKVINFFPDWITLNIRRKFETLSPTIAFLSSIIERPHNVTNAGYSDSFPWPESGYFVKLLYLPKNRQGEAVQVLSADGTPLFRILKINRKASKNPYEYQISFTGMFFDYERLGYHSVKNFFAIFLNDISNDEISYSISRLDICADVVGVSTLDVFNGIRGPMRARMHHTFYDVDPLTEMPASIDYGKKTSDWMCRIYNKLKEAIFNTKERFYPEHFKYPMVTRVEIQLNSKKCSDFVLTLDKCLDLDFLFSIYCEVLYQKKDTKFGVVNFIKKELKKTGIKQLLLVHRNHESVQLTEMEYLKEIIQRCNTACKRYGRTPEELIAYIGPLIKTPI